jgi:hypothetical protein
MRLLERKNHCALQIRATATLSIKDLLSELSIQSSPLISASGVRGGGQGIDAKRNTYRQS